MEIRRKRKLMAAIVLVLLSLCFVLGPVYFIPYLLTIFTVGTTAIVWGFLAGIYGFILSWLVPYIIKRG